MYKGFGMVTNQDVHQASGSLSNLIPQCIRRGVEEANEISLQDLVRIPQSGDFSLVCVVCAENSDLLTVGVKLNLTPRST